MKAVAVVLAFLWWSVLLVIAVSLVHADVVVYSSSSGSTVAGVYKTVRRAKRVRRQIVPGGNLVRAVFRGRGCTAVHDPRVSSWMCAAAIDGVFRAAGQTATSETHVVYAWNAERRVLTVASDAPVVSSGSGNDFAVGVVVRRGDQSFVAAVGVAEVVPGSRCRAFYATSATSDVSPVRVFDVPTRRAAISRVECGSTATPALELHRAGAAALYPSSETPGIRNSAVTQASIYQTICRAGWTATIRPPAGYTNVLKRQQMQEYGDTAADPAAQCMAHSANTKCYEEDHFIALELGGDPNDRRNLWPEPLADAQQKDWAENFLKRQVCGGAMTLRAAQRAIVSDWAAVYREFHPEVQQGLRHTGVVERSRGADGAEYWQEDVSCRE